MSLTRLIETSRFERLRLPMESNLTGPGAKTQATLEPPVEAISRDCNRLFAADEGRIGYSLAGLELVTRPRWNPEKGHCDNISTR
jgi:hypothetical protein